MAPFRAAYLALAFLFADGILPALASTSIAVAEPYEVNANETQVFDSEYAAGSYFATYESLLRQTLMWHKVMEICL